MWPAGGCGCQGDLNEAQQGPYALLRSSQPCLLRRLTGSSQAAASTSSTVCASHLHIPVCLCFFPAVGPSVCLSVCL